MIHQIIFNKYVYLISKKSQTADEFIPRKAVKDFDKKKFRAYFDRNIGIK